MFDDLADPDPPRPGPSTFESVLARATQLTRRRQRLTAGVGAVAVATLIAGIVAASVGGGTSRQSVSAAAGGSSPVTPSTSATATGTAMAPPFSAGPPGDGTLGTPAGGVSSGPPTTSGTVPGKIPPTPGATPSHPSADGTSGAEGHVTVGPTCPNQPSSGGQCQPQSVSGANVWATTQGNSAVAASTTSAADGSFHLALSPGVYDLHAQAGMSCRPQTITVQAGQISSIDINCDSGIR